MDNHIALITKIILQMNSDQDLDLEYHVIVTLLVSVIYDYLKGEISLNQVISILEDVEDIVTSNYMPIPN